MGRLQTPQTRQRISASLAGRPNPRKGTTGYRHTPQAKAKISAFHLGKGRSIEETLALKRRLNGQVLKRHLLRAGLIKDQCEICGIPPIWNDRQLVLTLDHKNGDRCDNRLINLRVTCPNCHSQTETFAGRNNRRDMRRDVAQLEERLILNQEVLGSKPSVPANHLVAQLESAAVS